MVDFNPRLDNYKPRRAQADEKKIVELASSLDEMLEPAATQRMMSYQQALELIRQCSYIIKNCNIIVKPEN